MDENTYQAVGTIVSKNPDKKGNADRCYGHLRADTKLCYFGFDGTRTSNINIDTIVSGNTFKVEVHKTVNNEYKATLIELINQNQSITTNEKANYIGSVITNILENAFTNKTINPEEFEDQVFQMLRLLGIENLYAYPKGNQGGKGDGFFAIKNLAVIYDCTLSRNFIDNKDFNKTGQIESYISLLRDQYISLPNVGEKYRDYDISTIKNRQVWIITRNEIDLKHYARTREYEKISIDTKNVTIQQIIEILYHRINNKNYDSNKLEQALSNL
jgi:hypothetical protein